MANMYLWNGGNLKIIVSDKISDKPNNLFLTTVKCKETPKALIQVSLSTCYITLQHPQSEKRQALLELNPIFIGLIILQII